MDLKVCKHLYLSYFFPKACNIFTYYQIFPPCYSQSPLQFCFEIYISLNSRNLFQFLDINYCILLCLSSASNYDHVCHGIAETHGEVTSLDISEGGGCWSEDFKE